MYSPSSAYPRSRVRRDVVAPESHFQHALESFEFAIDCGSLHHPVWVIPRWLLPSMPFILLDHLSVDVDHLVATEKPNQMLAVTFEGLLARLGERGDV